MDFYETVELRVRDHLAADDARTTLFGEMPLWKAVRFVIVDWETDMWRQQGAQILRSHGSPLDLMGIQSIYDEDHFPAKRDRGRKR